MSGSTIGGFIGGAIGFYFGGPEGARWGFMIGSAVGGYVDPVKVEGPRLTDAQTQTSNEGVPRPIIYGTCAVAGNIIQCGPLVEHKITEKASKGGPEQTTFTYTRTVAIRISEAAPIGGKMKLRRAWNYDKLVYDATGSGHLDVDSAKFRSILTFYDGSEDQLPDPTLEALPAANGGGVGNVPAYRGTCYVVLANLDCTASQGAVPQFRWEVSSSAEETEEECYPAKWIVGGSRSATQAAIALSSDAETFATTNEAFSCYYPTWVGDNILMGTAAGARFSTNNGVSFANTSGITGGDSTVGTAYCDGSWLVSKNGNNIFHSSDGVNFTGVSVNSSGPMAVAGIRVMTAYNASAYSDDGGVTWTEHFPSYAFDDGRHSCTSMASDGNKFIAATSGAVAPWDNNLFKYVGVAAWEPIDTPFSSTDTVSAIAYDPIELRWGAFSGRNFAYSADGETWTLVPNALPSGASPSQGSLAGFGGKWIIGVSTGISSAEIYSSTDGGLTWSLRPSNLDYAVVGAAHNGRPMQGMEFPDAHGFFVTTDGHVSAACTPATFTAGTVALSDVIADICDRVGIHADQVDCSALMETPVRGYALARQTTAAEAIRGLQDVFFFDLPEWGNSGDLGTKLRAVLRGGAPVLDLSVDDLVESDEDEETRPQAVEYPRKLSLTFADPDANYEPATEVAEREAENIKALSEIQISTAVVMTRSEAAAVADKQLRVAWEEAAGNIKREVPQAFSGYTSSDVVTHEGRRYRIDKTELADGNTTWEMHRDRASAVQSSASGADPLTPSSPASSARGPTILQVVNLPSLRSADNVPGVYLGVQGMLPGWIGADIYLSTDGGASEQLVTTIVNAATMGALAAACDEDDGESSGAISVQVYWGGELESITDAQMAARFNGFAITTAGVSEVGQFKTATEGATDRLYDLTDVFRGQLGTDKADHLAGDAFLLLDGAVQFLPLDAALSGQTLIFRAVSIGTAPANNPTTSIVFDPPVFVIDPGTSLA